MANSKKIKKTKAALNKLFKTKKNYLDEKYFSPEIGKEYSKMIDNFIYKNKDNLAAIK